MTDEDLTYNETELADLAHWLWMKFTQAAASNQIPGVEVSLEKKQSWETLWIPYTKLSREKQLIDLKLVKEWLQGQEFKQCPICQKWTKDFSEIETDIRHLWLTWDPKKGLDRKHADPMEVCGWCHDFITDNSPPDPDHDGSDTAYDIWVENQPYYPDSREDDQGW